MSVLIRQGRHKRIETRFPKQLPAHLASKAATPWRRGLVSVLGVGGWLSVACYALNIFYTQRIFWHFQLSGAMLGDDFHEAVAAGFFIFISWIGLLFQGQLSSAWGWGLIACIVLVGVMRVMLRVLEKWEARMQLGRKQPGRVVLRIGNWVRKINNKVGGFLSDALLGGSFLLTVWAALCVILVLLIPFFAIAYAVADSKLELRGLEAGKQVLQTPQKLMSPKRIALENGVETVGDILMTGRLGYLVLTCDGPIATLISTLY